MATELEGITIELEGIGHLLKDSRLTVPPYQRSYAWTEKNIDQLFRDLSTAIEDKEQEYFLGSIVLINTKHDRPSVVDGQQRLATITILLAAIRDYFSKITDSRAGEIERDYLLHTDLRTQEKLANLKLNETDNEYFYQRVLLKKNNLSSKGLKDSHQRINECVRKCERQVEAITKLTIDPAARLIDWIEFLLNKVRIIKIRVPDSANAFRIFETLNDRGLKLALSDLLKNYLFHKSDDRINEVQANWIAMTSIIEAAEDEELIVDFIRHYWCSKYSLTREKELYDKIKNRINSKQKAIEFSIDIANTAKIYAAMVNTDNELWMKFGSEARSYMSILNLFGMTQIRPLVLSVLEKFSSTEIKKALKLFVSWTVRFVIVGGVGGGTLENHYSNFASKVTEGKIKNVRSLFNELKKHIPSDDEFKKSFAVASASKTPLARYYLRELETKADADIEHEFVPNPNEEQVTLEHILPQNRTRDWEHFDQESLTRVYKRIGNLALMKKTNNREAANSSFKEKVKIFSKSEFQLTKELKKYSDGNEWTINSIDKRQSDLADLAVKAWPNKVRP